MTSLRPLGMTDLLISPLGLGAWAIGCGEWQGGWGPQDDAVSVAAVHRAVELGVNFIDTADSYGPEVSETLIAEALHPYRPGLVIATKAGLVRPSAGEWKRNARPAHLKAACDASLKRLRLERIDVFQLHAPDPQVPFAESVGALAELQRAGKIRHIGVSNVDVRHLDEARGIVRVVSVQNRYNLGDRMHAPVLEDCETDNLAFIPWYPLAAGPLARSRGALERVAKRHGVTSAQIALAWLLQHSPVMLPIPGTGSVEHLEENVAAAAVRLSSSDIRELES